MLINELLLLQVTNTETHQEPHRAPALPDWANGDGEEGASREGDTEEPANNNSSARLLLPIEKQNRFNVPHFKALIS